MSQELTIEEAKAWLDKQDTFVCPEWGCLMPRRDCGLRYTQAWANKKYWDMHLRSVQHDIDTSGVEKLAPVASMARCLYCPLGKKHSKQTKTPATRPHRPRSNAEMSVPPRGKIGLPLPSMFRSDWQNG